MKKTEVLVHTSTPATKVKDDLYRSLADAYLAFEPYQPNQDAVDGDTPPESFNIQPNHLSSSQKQSEASAFYTVAPILTSMDSYGSFPSHLTSGEHSSDQHNSESNGIPSSDDVSVSRLERLEHIQTRWKGHRNTRSRSANSRRQSFGALILPEKDDTFIEDTQQALQDMESQLPDHLSTTSEEDSDADMVENSVQDPDDATEAEISRTPFGPSSGNLQVESLSKVHQDQEPILKKAIKVTAIEKTRHVRSSQHSFTSVESTSKGSSQTEDPRAPTHDVNFDTLPSMACPPPPKISMLAPGKLPSQITPYLEKLKQQNPRRFKPKAIPRAIEPDERGHWRVDCRLWPIQLQQQFWTFVQKDVEAGRLGWGVTLHRDAARMRLGLVRLYCWGEIAEHVWLALWLHSGGRVWSTGAVWVDGGDTEIINIP